MLKHFLETENTIGFGAAPLGRIDRAGFQGWQDITTTHGDRRNTNVLVALPRDSWRSAEAIFTKIIHTVDGLLEPAQCFRADRLQHQAFNVHAHLGPQLVIQGFATTIHVPGDPGNVVDAQTRARGGGAKQHCGRVITRPIMCPRETAFNQAFVHRFKCLFNSNNCARGKHFDINFAVGKGPNVVRKVV